MATIVNVQKINDKAHTHEVMHVAGIQYAVVSGESGSVYSVMLVGEGAVCTCPWGSHRKADDPRSACSHVQAVMEVIARENDRKAKAHGSKAQARRTHRKMQDIGDGVTLTLRKVGA